VLVKQLVGFTVDIAISLLSPVILTHSEVMVVPCKEVNWFL